MFLAGSQFGRQLGKAKADEGYRTGRDQSVGSEPSLGKPQLSHRLSRSTSEDRRLAPVHHNPHLGRGAVVGALTARFRNDRRELFTNARNKLAITT